MRKFSELEKKIIEAIIKIHQTDDGYSVLNNIFHFAKGVVLPTGFYLQVGPQVDHATFLVEKEACTFCKAFTKREVQAFKLVASVVVLFRHLENLLLITLTNSNFDKSKSYFIGENPVVPTFEFQGIDYEYRADLYRFATSRIFVAEELITYVQQGYKTEDEIAHDREISLLKSQLRFSQIAFGFSFFGLLVSIGFSAYQVLSTPKMDLQGSAIESISNSLQEMSKKEN